MQEAQTWRELLGTLIHDPQERQRIAELLDVKPITLMRWATGKSNPRPDNLRPLLDALPQQRAQLIELIAKELPHIVLAPPLVDDAEIPPAFYAQVVNAYSSSPEQLRSSSVCMLILQQMLGQLDPQRLGMSAAIVQCVPPREGQKVHSLRPMMARGTPPFESQSDGWPLLVGAESQAGQAVVKAHPVVVHNREERARLFPVHRGRKDESSAVYPILSGVRVAGSLNLCSMQPNYYVSNRLELIQSYSELLTLAFEECEFYDPQAIELRIMPEYERQRPLTGGFRQRVARHLTHSVSNQRPLTRKEAERLTWQEIEEALLHSI